MVDTPISVAILAQACALLRSPTSRNCPSPGSAFMATLEVFMMFISCTCDISDNMKGAGLFLLQQMCIVSNDAIMKVASKKTSLFQALCIRGSYVSILLTILAWSCGQLQSPVPRSDRRILAARCLCDFCANCFYLTALFHMPLANTTAISQLTPLAVTFAAAIWFREAIEPGCWVMLILSFCGVLIKNKVK